MQTLQISKDNALKAYSKADDNGKKLLEELFGDTLVLKITDRVKTFENACEVLGIKPDDVTPKGGLAEDMQSTIAYCKLSVIVRALNEGWQPNWKDEDEYKWYPWFYMDDPDIGFVLYRVIYDAAISSVGSRLCFKNRELAEYAANQFLPEYKAFFTL